MSSDDILPFVWKTPVLNVNAGEPLDYSPLLRFPVVLQIVLKLLDIWDLRALIGTGNPLLTNFMRRSCKKIDICRRNKLFAEPHQVLLNRDPFDFILGFPSLTTLTIISPNWKPKPYTASPLFNLPSSLRHLTLWTAEMTSLSDLDLVFVPYPTLFPGLETLRLCFRVQMAQRMGEKRPFTVDLIPPTVRTLSLVMSLVSSLSLAKQILYPIGSGIAPARDEPAFAHLLPSSTDHATTNISSHTLNKKYRFEALEYFEWGGFWSYNCPLDTLRNPDWRDMPPNLLHYVRQGSDSALGPLPSRRNVKRPQIGGNRSGLLSFIFGNEPLPPTLPSTLTRLSLLESRGRPAWANDKFHLRFPHLRVLETSLSLDTHRIHLPDSLERLSFYMDESAEKGLFSVFPAPASLTHLALTSCEINTFKGLPATLRHLYFTAPLTGSIFRTQVVPCLPKQLLSLRISVSEFSPEYLALLPRGLLELVIFAQSMLLPEWKKGGTWSADPIEFDVTDLPPQLEHLSLKSVPYGIRFPASMLGKLPRTLKSLTISSVLLDSYDPRTSANTEPSSSFIGSSVFSFIGSLSAQLLYRTNLVAPEAIKSALALLPEDCWCRIWFKADIEGDSVRDRKPQPTDLVSSVRRLLPAPLLASSLLINLNRCTLAQAAAPFH